MNSGVVARISSVARFAHIIETSVVMISRIVAFDGLMTVLTGFVVVPMVMMSCMQTTMFAVPMAKVVSVGVRLVKTLMSKTLIAG